MERQTPCEMHGGNLTRPTVCHFKARVLTQSTNGAHVVDKTLTCLFRNPQLTLIWRLPGSFV